MVRLITLLIVTFVVFCACTKKEEHAETLFHKLDSSFTHISFINSVSDQYQQISAVDYLYYYNGAGMAAGDVNNDGLSDLFFAANTGDNKLFINLGNLQFKDITTPAGVEGYASWKTGVTMADVNADGLIDIYVCAVAGYQGLEGSNELYINNGDGTFTEDAAAYGLDFSGFSTHAVFFDFDHDGDLDMYLLTHGSMRARAYDRVTANYTNDSTAVDHLFRNDEGKYKDISASAGITHLAHGLGVTIADINNDGWEDLYVSNDFYEDDQGLINNRDGTFREEGRKRFSHYSRFSRGCSAADINNDGLQDLMTLDIRYSNAIMDENAYQEDPQDFYYKQRASENHTQVFQNALQINNGDGYFSDFAPMAGVAHTGWSWAPLIADFNNDGFKDIFITSGIYKDLMHRKYLDFAHKDSMRYAPKLTQKQIAEAIEMMPHGYSHNNIYEGDSAMNFTTCTQEWGLMQVGVSNSAVYADLDNDGDLDIVTNSTNQPPNVYRNDADKLLGNNFLSIELRGDNKNVLGIGAKVYVWVKNDLQLQQVNSTVGFISSVKPLIHFGLGKNEIADSVVVIWNDGRKQVFTNVKPNIKIVADQRESKISESNSTLNTSTTWFSDATQSIKIPYTHKENPYADFVREPLMPFLVSKEGPAVALGDVNADGREDIFIGGAKHQPGSIFLQKANDEFIIAKQKAFTIDSVYEDVDATFFDADNDKDLDLYVVSAGNEFYGNSDKLLDRLYRNDGKGNFTRDSQALPLMFENKSCVRSNDFDQDGDIDLFVGGRVVAYRYGQSPTSYLLVNDGKGQFSNLTMMHAPALQKIGMVTDAFWADIDQDKDDDLIVVGEWMKIKIFENQKGKFNEIKTILSDNSPVKNISGLWQCVAATDFDHDGDVDFVAGNLGLNTLLRQAGDRSILKMLIRDSGTNKKSSQLILYNSNDDNDYPLASLLDLQNEFSDEFDSTSTTPKKAVNEIFKSFTAKHSQSLSVDQFASLYFENLGNKRFAARPLPFSAQLSKMYCFFVDDFNKDGNTDLLGGGNFSGGNSYHRLYDASLGVVLKGISKGTSLPFTEQPIGEVITGEVRDIKKILTSSGAIYIIAKNNGPLQLIRFSLK